MKNFLILFLSFSVLAACSSNDDDSNGQEPIVGTWVLVQVVPPIVNFQDCDDDSTITFNADNTAQGAFYITQNDCDAANSDGTWSRNGNNYTVEIPILGTVTGRVDFTGSSRFTFSTSGAVFTFERQ